MFSISRLFSRSLQQNMSFKKQSLLNFLPRSASNVAAADAQPKPKPQLSLDKPDGSSLVSGSAPPVLPPSSRGVMQHSVNDILGKVGATGSRKREMPDTLENTDDRPPRSSSSNSSVRGNNNSNNNDDIDDEYGSVGGARINDEEEEKCNSSHEDDRSPIAVQCTSEKEALEKPKASKISTVLLDSSSSKPQLSSLGSAEQSDEPHATVPPSGSAPSTGLPRNEWVAGQPVPFAHLSLAFKAISDESGRLKSTDYLAACFREIRLKTPDDLLPAVYLSTGTIAPPYAGVELGIGNAAMQKAIGEAYGKSVPQLKTLFEQIGDWGDVAQASKKGLKMLVKPQKLTVRGVFDAFKKIAAMSGKNSQDLKRSKMIQLMISCDAEFFEPLFLTRALEGNMRMGCAEQTVLDALSDAFGADKEDVKNSFNECPSFDVLVRALLDAAAQNGDAKCRFVVSDRVTITPGVPVKPMLAKPSNMEEVAEKCAAEPMKFVTCEYKYDGERAQLHLSKDGNVHIFSRNSENHTLKFPEISSGIKKHFSKESFIIDAEVVAMEGNKILPFQTLSTRARKNVDASAEQKVLITVFAFDLLFYNGESLIAKPLKERRDLLKKFFTPVPGLFDFATFDDMDATDAEEMTNFFHQSLVANCEGIMVKVLADPYEPGRRSAGWFKVKKDYQEGLMDSLDLVPIGAYLGKGKRTGVYGAFLLACYDSDRDEYQSICKIGTGFSEEDLQKFTDLLKEHVIPARPPQYSVPDKSDLIPDVWFDTKVVWEVRAADLSLSPVHRAAYGTIKDDRGVALRFPRFLRVRTDKAAQDATSAEQVVDMYHNQASIK
ncbi:mitochondrial ATP-dependent DNA ligase [Andalucia godoyi]|uniref:DNA ligase n=1 Tax=Andalucia godoyi TaxID=505711 RepID=A0A8K0AK21_ANDGO|nr:mitochondrial ATP-dependent DNA ligase [Andalucia godoyi]|eukprot:ANDGO_02663.mRNA.1 mitochondrial ATP-dependent DNA ligase